MKRTHEEAGIGVAPPKRFLARKNAHPRDDRIVFDDSEGRHKYTIYSNASRMRAIGTNDEADTTCAHYLSCTTFVKTGFAPFDQCKIAGIIVAKCGATSYYAKYGHLTERDILDGMWPLFRTLGSYMHDRFEAYYNREWRLRDARRAAEEGNALFFREFYDEFRAFAAEWPHLVGYFNNECWMPHLLGDTVEDDRAGSRLPPIPPEIRAFGRFVNDHRPHLEAYRTEWLVFDEELRLCGAIDIVFYDRNLGGYVIYDWKRSRQLQWNNYGKHGNAEWSKTIPDTNTMHYRLQLHIYAMMLQRQYNIWPCELALVRCHPDARGDYQKFAYSVDQALIEKLIDVRKRQIAEL